MNAFADPERQLKKRQTEAHNRAALSPTPMGSSGRRALRVLPSDRLGQSGIPSAELIAALQWLAELLRYRVFVLGEDAAQAEEKGGVSASPKPTSDRLLGMIGLLVSDLSEQTGRPPSPLDDPPPLPPDGWMPRFATRFGLDPVEALLVAAAVAPACDGRFAAAFGELAGSAGPDRATADLMGQLLGLTLAERAQLAGYLRVGRPLERFSLLVMDFGDTPELPLSRQPLDVPARVLWFLLDGADREPEMLRGAVKLREPRWSVEDAPFEATVVRHIKQCVARYEAAREASEVQPLLIVEGPVGGGHREVAECVAAAFDKKVLEAHLGELLFSGSPHRLASALMREALLRDAILFISMESGDQVDEQGDTVVTDEHYRTTVHFLDEALADFPLPIVVTGDYASLAVVAQARRELLYVKLRLPERREQERTVLKSLAQNSLTMDDEAILDVLSRYHLDHRTTDEVIRSTRALLQSGCGQGTHVEPHHMEEALELVLSRNLGNLTHRLMARASWDDLVLHEDLTSQLKALTFLIENRFKIFDEWGLRQVGAGRGVKALFSGPSGTGKTLSSEVIATELRLPLYRVDVSQLLSKWVGETEKNIDRVFRDAQASQAILLFDEADSLFGQRGSVEGGGDRWANLQVNFLLQRFEVHDGVVLLTTNMPNAIDTAFARRMHFVIEFRLPTEEMRKVLWAQMLDSKLPLGDDLDLDFLAERFELSASNIKNAIMAGAFLAAAEGDVVDMRQICRGLQLEFHKLGRGATRSDFGPYFKYLDMDPY